MENGRSAPVPDVAQDTNRIASLANAAHSSYQWVARHIESGD
jgi:hypothetical protein